jgi:antirestriction protein ArdC
MSKASAEALRQRITDELIAQIEAGAGSWKMPWNRIAQSGVPMSLSSGKPYKGINWWLLSAQQMHRGYRSNWWATYNQWSARECQVRKGQSGDEFGSTEVFLWKPTERKTKNDAGETETRKSLFATTFRVFNADQVDGEYADKLKAPPVKLAEHERHHAAEAFFEAIGANVTEGGDRAFYAPAQDYIAVPQIGQFPVRDHYYSTLAHEHTHWTGHASRLNRDLHNRFGSEAYAAEELIAEIGAAFLAAQLDLEPAARQDHSSYLAGWLKILRADSSAIITAAARAGDAVEYLNKLAGAVPAEPDKELISA